ncbi:hypothetical protein E5288_WYG010499 [Bos mutus]|uniref:Uncharacterized protein n=1 Tax=Bos mutus TaxID=72004 RepID=A0A6B0SD92_9CETA|nr:hypothetical protein [Bos mutus]
MRTQHIASQKSQTIFPRETRERGHCPPHCGFLLILTPAEGPGAVAGAANDTAQMCFCLPQNKEEVRYLKSLALFRVPPDGSSEDNGGKGHSAIEGLPE